MPHAPLTPFDQTVLDLIEHNPTGSVPHTPTYDESLARLLAAQQVYHSADFKDGLVTARSLSRRPAFVAAGLQELAAHPEDHSQLESNLSVYDRYVASLPEPLRPRAETFRLITAGRPVHHRAKAGGEVARDPLHSVFLVPGTGPKLGLPGNFLRGSIDEMPDRGPAGGLANPDRGCRHRCRGVRVVDSRGGTGPVARPARERPVPPRRTRIAGF
jgi:hypothetical protein